jgi:hypothetical protein
MAQQGRNRPWDLLSQSGHLDLKFLENWKRYFIRLWSCAATASQTTTASPVAASCAPRSLK